jgi:T-complex protein 1 subunit theta
MLCLKVGSKWELRRLCLAVNATALVRLGAPTPEEMGTARSVAVKEIASRTVTVFETPEDGGKLATIVLRASTMSVLNDLERAVDDGVQAVVQAGKDGRLVYGGGAAEMALSAALLREAEQVPGLEQYGLAAFGKALQFVPRTLAENAGWDATRVVADLQSAHAAASKSAGGNGTIACDLGVDIERQDGAAGGSGGGSLQGTASMEERHVYDVLSTKLSALRLAVDAAVTILKIDQIIMSKPSGGPKM